MHLLLSPLTWLLCAFAVLLLQRLRRIRLRWLAPMAVAVAVSAIATMTPLAANALGAGLERLARTPGHCESVEPDIAVVLGGGVDARPAGPGDASVLNLASRRRIDRAVDWQRAGEGRVLVVVGGAPHRGVPAVAEVMAAYAHARGLPDSAIRTETDSGDTWGNARDAARLLPRLPRRIVLVTSWMHMPRARLAFERVGFDICPLGTDRRRLPSRLPWALMPRTSGLANSELALHEWVGLAWYHLRSH